MLEEKNKIRILVIGDTHGMHGQLKLDEYNDIDILIHAGDMTASGKEHQLIEFYGHLSQTNFKHIVLIAGNHDNFCEKDDIKTRYILKNDKIHYLNESGCEIMGIKFWGSPWTPFFNDWSFNIIRGEEEEHWEKIPNDVDILITHGPPYGILDESSYKFEHCGCKVLAEKIEKIKPKFHVFGHVHEGYGIMEKDGISYINGSICTSNYEPINQPILIEYEI